MAAIVVILAASINVQAQLGGALNRAREAVQGTGQQNTGNQQTQQQQSSTTTVQPAAAPAAAQQPANQRAAIDKLMNESRRSAPPVTELTGDQDRGGSPMRTFFAGIPKMSEDDVKAFRAKIDARHAENLEIFAALWEVPGNAAEFVENSHARVIEGLSFRPGVSEALSTQTPANGLKQEIINYKAMITEFRRMVTNEGDVEIKGNFADGSAETTMKSLVVGITGLRWMDEKWVFVVKGNLPNEWIITPVDENMYNLQNAKYTNLLWLLNKEGSIHQYDEYWKASVARNYLGMGQKNALANETKVAVPAAQMNDAALTARMLKMAQEAYPTWGIVRLIIVESAWRPETNALGQIIHRRINTKIILPRSGGGYIMRTLSFIEPYSGGTYGEARPFGIGTDEVAVDYKP